jgi:Tfp pilus assembly protein PilZ
MPLALAVRLLEERSGAHFEKKVVKALIDYLKMNIHLLGEIDTQNQVRESRHRRVPCRTSVSFRVDGRTVSGTSTDISLKGMYVAIEDDMEEGSPIEVTFTLPNNLSVKIQAKGRIAWVNNARKRLKPVFPSGVGVEFLDVEPAVDVLQSFVGSYAS